MQCESIPIRGELSNAPLRYNVLDLFSGIGGFSRGLEMAGMHTQAFCEIEPYCRKVLAKHWPGVKIHDDVKQLKGNEYAGTIDVICGGYPCQPFSLAGKQKGEEDPRHLWPEMHRIIRETRPRIVIAENVRGHVSLGFDTVAAQLEDDGFTVWPFLIPACAVNAPHRRERLWIVAYAKRAERRPGQSCGDDAYRQNAKREEATGRFGASGEDGRERAMADSTRELLHGSGNAGQAGRHEFANRCETLANSISPRLEGYAGHGDDGDEPEWNDPQPNRSTGEGGIRRPVADTADGSDQPGGSQFDVGGFQEEVLRKGGNSHDWDVEPAICRVANGIPNRIHRLRALGNAVVPQVVEMIGRTIIQYERQLAKAA